MSKKTTENKSTYDNIRQLTGLNKQPDLPELVKNIRESKRQLDTLLKRLKDREKEFELEAIAPKAEQSVSMQQNAIDDKQQSAPIEVAEIASEVLTTPKTADAADADVKKVEEIKTSDSAVIDQAKAEPPKPLQQKPDTAEIIAEGVSKSSADKAATTDIKKKTDIKTVTDEQGSKTEKVDSPNTAVLQKTETEKPKTSVAGTGKNTVEAEPKKKFDKSKKPAETTAARPVKKAKTAEEKFKDSLPKPVNTENRRFINLTPDRPAPGARGGGGRGGYASQDQRPAAARQPGGRPQYPQSGGGFRKDGDTPSAPFQRSRPAASGPVIAPVADIKKDTSKFSSHKKKTPDKADDKKVMNKRTLLRRGFEADPTLAGDDVRMGSKKFRNRKRETPKNVIAPVVIEKAVITTEMVPLKVLSDKLGITAAQITKMLFKEGIIKTINESIDFPTAELIAMELGIEIELKLDRTAEDTLAEFHIDEAQDHSSMVKRPPVVTVMGHVDHGKTSLLDAIKKTNVVEGEAGGITQHIGAYTITINEEKITFIDTPGHEAFTSMRARGASVTDIAILVVAADDGIMPQTIEAISHAKSADVPIIVAINKMDKQTANPERIKQQLTEHGLVPEEWGGDAIICPVSAVTRDGIDKLLEMVLLLADVKELKANPDRNAKGTIIEAQLDKGRGPVATILVQNGTLRVGDTVVAGITSGRIRAMLDDKGQQLKEAGPSIAVSVLGFSEVPNAGDAMFALDDERLTRQVAEERINKIREDMVQSTTKVTLDDIFGKISEGQIKGLNLIIKADVQGSVEALRQALEKLSNEEVKVNIIHGGVGAISESDVTLAQTASAIIIGFNVRPDINARQLSDRSGIDIRLYRVIYEVTEDVSKALKGMLEPKYKENVLGQAEVRNTFRITGVGTVAGCYVTSGKILRNAKVRLLRDNVVITEGDISSLKRFKDDVREVAQGFECGISIEGYNDIKESDVIECFRMEEIIS